jgi:prevent-host-death family protein
VTTVDSPIHHNSIAVSDLRDSLADVLGRVQYAKERVVVTNYGRPVGVIVPLDDLELIEALEDQVDVQAALEARNDPENAGERVSWRELKARRA